MATATTISDADIVSIAAQYSIPPALLAGVVKASGASDTLGLPDATLSAYQLSPVAARNDPMLLLAVAARVLSQAFAQSNSWEEALSAFLTGDPRAYQSPTSLVGGQVESILGAAAIDPTFGLGGFRPANAQQFAQMGGALATHMQGMLRSGGAVTAQTLQAYQQQFDQVAASAHQTSFAPDPNLQQMATAVLAKMSELSGTPIPATLANIALITTMARGEGMPAQDFNWLATTQGQGVGTVPGTPGVKIYGSYEQGIEATARTFLNGNFDELLGKMRSGADLSTMARDPGVQRNLRTWQGGSDEDVRNLLGTANVSGGSLGGTTITQGLQAAAQNNAQGYSEGECAWYAARSLGFIPGGLGNAKDWAGRASAMGMQVDATPAVGTAVVYGAGGMYSPQYGHVAVVKAVNPDGTFTVSEMNVDGQGVADERVSTMQGVIGFIHPPPGTDMATAAPGLAQQVAATSASTPQQQARQQAAVMASSSAASSGSTRRGFQDSEPQPAQVSDFAAQLQAAGIPPKDFAEFFPTVAAAIRRDVGSQHVDLSNYVQAHQGVLAAGQPVNHTTLVAQVRSQPHPTYPNVTVGQVADAKNAAALHSVTHTGQLPTTAEAARLASSQASWKEMSDYYQQKAAIRQRAVAPAAAPQSTPQPSGNPLLRAITGGQAPAQPQAAPQGTPAPAQADPSEIAQRAMDRGA